jgi:predicted O-methyltransferase YrrM
MSINEYLNNRNCHIIEGYSQEIPGQVENLIKLTDRPNLNVMEIGFNAGHSADVFLKNNNTLILTSFDLGDHDYVKHAKTYIDETYPNRHNLILGDSRVTVPDYIKNNEIKFDVIFIDGGHEYEISNADMENCFYLAHKDTIVIMDDTIFTNDWKREWNIGPTRTWTEYLEQNRLVELGRIDYYQGRGMAWGKYVM